MTQNVYDDETFFEGYSRLPRSVGGLGAAPEWPALLALLPKLDGARVLDLGCGFGWFCRFARERGAASVLGIDVSERMLARAKAETNDAAVAFRRADLESLDLPPASFDLAYSSLAFHYIVALDALLARVHAALAPGGRFVFSVEHPMLTAPDRPGWSADEAGRPTWPVSRYLDEGPRRTNWIVDGVVKQHRTIGTYAGLLLQAGFAITHIEEWGPSREQVAASPEWVKERERPFFLLMSARKDR